jgi:hypothetical protein
MVYNVQSSFHKQHVPKPLLRQATRPVGQQTPVAGDSITFGQVPGKAGPWGKLLLMGSFLGASLGCVDVAPPKPVNVPVVSPEETKPTPVVTETVSEPGDPSIALVRVADNNQEVELPATGEKPAKPEDAAIQPEVEPAPAKPVEAKKPIRVLSPKEEQENLYAHLVRACRRSYGHHNDHLASHIVNQTNNRFFTRAQSARLMANYLYYAKPTKETFDWFAQAALKSFDEPLKKDMLRFLALSEARFNKNATPENLEELHVLNRKILQWPEETFNGELAVAQ